MQTFVLNPQRVSKLGRDTERTMMLGEAKLWPGLAAHVSASHEAVSSLVTYLTELDRVPVGVTSMPEKMALSWQASQQASKVLKAARKRIEQEAKDLAEEVTAEEAAVWQSKLPDTATRLRAMEVLERYVGQGKLEMVTALMQDAGIAAVLATTNRRLIHENMTQTYQSVVTRTALKAIAPEIIEKAEKAEELLELATGYSEAIKIVDYAVSSQQAAAAWESRPVAPAMPEPVTA